MSSNLAGWEMVVKAERSLALQRAERRARLGEPERTQLRLGARLLRLVHLPVATGGRVGRRSLRGVLSAVL